MVLWDCLLNDRIITETGLEEIERLRFLASFPLPGTGKREGGEKKQPFNRFPPHLVIFLVILLDKTVSVIKDSLCIRTVAVA